MFFSNTTRRSLLNLARASLSSSPLLPARIFAPVKAPDERIATRTGSITASDAFAAARLSLSSVESADTKPISIVESPTLVQFEEFVEITEIPYCKDSDHPDFAYFQSSSRIYKTAKSEGKAYRRAVRKFRKAWTGTSRSLLRIIRMLSVEKQEILGLSKSEFMLALPAYADLRRFEIACVSAVAASKARDRAFELDLQIDEVESIGAETDEPEVEFQDGEAVLAEDKGEAIVTVRQPRRCSRMLKV